MKRLERDESETRDESEERDERKKRKQRECTQDMLVIDKKTGVLASGANGSVWVGCCQQNCGFAVKVIYLGDDQQRKYQFERQATIAWYAGEHMGIGPNIYDYFEAIKSVR